MRTKLNGASSKSDLPEKQLEDAVETITSLCGSWVLYSDGSAKDGTNDGGSAVVVTRGNANDPERVTAVRKAGAQQTSSFETEVEALLLAVQWCCNNNSSDVHNSDDNQVVIL